MLARGESGETIDPADLDQNPPPPDSSENAECKPKAAEVGEGDPENAEGGPEVVGEEEELPLGVIRTGSASPRAEFGTSPSLARVGVWKAVGAAVNDA